MPMRPLLRLVIEFEPGEPVAGWVGARSQPKVHFEGLLHLVSVLEDARLGRWPLLRKPADESDTDR